MTFRHLPESLHATAKAAATYFRSTFGVTHFVIEESIHDDVEYRPTLSGQTRDFHTLCVEVSERAYNPALDSAVMDMRQNGLPVRLFVAIPGGDTDKNFKSNLKMAKSRSVGIVEVGTTKVIKLANALSQSLAGLRSFKPKDYPMKYRLDIHSAYDTFLDGNPPQGCQTLYSEIEALTRRIATKAGDKGYWRSVTNSIRVDFQNGAWARIVAKLRDELNRTAAHCPNLNTALWNRVGGITGHRNDTGHKPKDRAYLIRRDRELRTRFESAMDILNELITASKPLRV